MRTLLATFILLLALNASAAVNSLYVSPAGSDAAPGTRAQPLASLERAKILLRAVDKRANKCEVVFLDGIHPIRFTVAFTAEDGGRAGAPVVYRAEHPGLARLTGGRALRGFAPVRDPAVLARLAPRAKEAVLCADLAAAGIDPGALQERGFAKSDRSSGLELVYEGSAMTLARWPDRLWAHVREVKGEKFSMDAQGVKRGSRTDTFFVHGERPFRWQQTGDIWLHGFWYHDWADNTVRVKSLNSSEGSITLEAPLPAFGITKDMRYYAFNILEELDRPGEYCVDRQAKKVYVWPPGPLGAASLLSSELEEPLLRIREASHLAFSGLVFEATRRDLVEVSGGTGVTYSACTFRNAGGSGLKITGGSNHAVLGCELYELGDRGIFVSGGDVTTLVPCGHLVENNHIHHVQRLSYTYQPAIQVSGVGVAVRNNVIHDMPHSAIIYGGNDHLFEYNEIYNCVVGTGDSAAVYMGGRNWTSRGNRHRFSFIHDLPGFIMHHQIAAIGIYLDDCISSADIETCVFYNLPTYAGVLLGGGRDHLVKGNLFINCKYGVHLDARCAEPFRKWQIDTKKPSWEFFDKLEKVKYDKPPYSTRYPALAKIKEGNPYLPEGTRLTGNRYFGGDSFLALQTGAQKYTNNPVVYEIEGNSPLDPGIFLDYGGLDFRLKPGIVTADGFAPFPWDRLGLKVDANRSSLPETGSILCDIGLEPGEKAGQVRFTVRAVNYTRAKRTGTIELFLTHGDDTPAWKETMAYELEARARLSNTYSISVEARHPVFFADAVLSGERTIRSAWMSSPSAMNREAGRLLSLRAPRPPTLDGRIEEDAWGTFAPDRSVALSPLVPAAGREANAAGRFMTCHDEKNLYLAFRIEAPTDGTGGAKAQWGTHDGVEAAIQFADPARGRKTYVVHGLRAGRHEAEVRRSTAPEDSPDFEKAIRYATAPLPQGWGCEFAIPFAALGVDSQYAGELLFNAGGLRQEGERKQWFAWVNTGGANYDVERAGVLLLTGRCAANSKNLLANSDLEEGQAPWTPSFQAVESDKAELTRVKEGPDGSWCLRLTTKAEAAMQKGVLKWLYPVSGKMKPGRYLLSFDLRVAGFAPSDRKNGKVCAYLHVTKDGKPGGNIGQTEYALVNPEIPWTRRMYEVVVPDGSEPASVTLQLHQATGTVWFDNIALLPCAP